MEGMTYQDVLAFSKSWGSVYFLILFVIVCVYAFWPSNKPTFEKAAHAPLADDEDAP